MKCPICNNELVYLYVDYFKCKNSESHSYHTIRKDFEQTIVHNKNNQISYVVSLYASENKSRIKIWNGKSVIADRDINAIIPLPKFTGNVSETENKIIEKIKNLSILI